MLKVYDLAGRAPREGGETVLGLKDLGTHACYMLYGVLNPGEPPRIFKPGEGHEEIILAVSGTIQVKGEGDEFTLQAGQAIHLKGAVSYKATTDGPLEARYVASGGHTPHEDGHHHHH